MFWLRYSAYCAAVWAIVAAYVYHKSSISLSHGANGLGFVLFAYIATPIYTLACAVAAFCVWVLRRSA